MDPHYLPQDLETISRALARARSRQAWSDRATNPQPNNLIPYEQSSESERCSLGLKAFLFVDGFNFSYTNIC